MTLLGKTRYYRSEDLHLKMAASPGPDGWHFHSLKLVTGKDSVNFGIGEGPKKHQRYLLFSSLPTPERKILAQEEVIRLEGLRGCRVAGPGFEQEPKKEALNNFYLWKNERGGFQFVLSPLGQVLHATDHAEVGLISREGGKRSKPRFFNTLKYSMLAVPSIAKSFLYAIGTEEPVQWDMECAQIYGGISDLVKHVYRRKMTILAPEGRYKEEKVSYKGHFVSGTSVLRIEADTGPFPPVPIRVSGLKGTLWIESYKREIYLEVTQKRILKDILEISFGIDRNKKVFNISGDKNVVRVSLVDECFLGCAGSDHAIRISTSNCSSDEPAM